ncbi:Endoplasmic reticulum-based factor for assembly of V-ATPase [Fragilaria crotonensis]|nr:Endoplasmic reticulum-based factor for assembly of V-ATPase [Fragilaria crotonensis]
MPSKWPWGMPERKNNASKTILEGIELTPALRKVLSKAVDERDNSKGETFYSMPADEAVAVLEKFLSEKDTHAVPLEVIRAATTLLKDPSDLSAALSTKLVFSTPTSPPTKTEEEACRFQKRMDRLRLRAEESRYKALTGNIDTYVADDVTVKSMTYAASVGLNMIVAPISFGVFMYFFAGQIFTWISASPHVELGPHEVDIRRVIAGVISGVAMLFIEMILFVIRTHTMDKSSRKKAQKMKTISPFGYAKPDAATVLSPGVKGSK